MRALAPLLLAALVLAPLQGQAQTPSARTIHLDDPAYVYIERLQRRGHLLRLNPTLLPYREGEVLQALDEIEPGALDPVAATWAGLVRARMSPPPPPGRIRVEGEIGPRLRATNNERFDPVRFSDSTATTLDLGGLNLYPSLQGRLTLTTGPFVLDLGVRTDVFFADDPEGLTVGFPNSRLRTENAVLGVAGRLGEAYLARTDRHWGRYGGPGLLVSDNPQPYDHLYLRLGGPRLSASILVGELDSSTQDGRFTGRCGDSFLNTPCDRRFLAAHRFDFRPIPELHLAFLESILYSGPDAGLSLPYLIPVGYVDVVNGTPKNFEHNAFMGGLLWARIAPVTLQGQVVIDDFALSGRGEPAAIVATGSASWAGVRAWIDASLETTVATARTYNTDQFAGKYLFGRRGLGTAFSDFVHLRSWADLYLDRWVPGLTVSPELQALWQGEGDPREPQLALSEPLILTGVVQRTVRVGTRLRFQRDARWWARADVGVNHTTNDGAVAGQSATRFVGEFELGVRLRIGRALSLEW